jgi:hypothetical protein
MAGTVRGHDTKDWEASYGLHFPLDLKHGTKRNDFVHPDDRFMRAGFGRSENGVGFYMEPHGETAWEYAGAGEVPGVVLTARVGTSDGFLASTLHVAPEDAKRLALAARLLGETDVAVRIERLPPGSEGREYFAAADMRRPAGTDIASLAGFKGYYAGGDSNFVFFRADSVPTLQVHAVYRGMPVLERPAPSGPAPRVEPADYRSEDLRIAHSTAGMFSDPGLREVIERAADALHAGPFAKDGFAFRQSLGVALSRAFSSGLVLVEDPVHRQVAEIDRDAGRLVREALDAARIAWAGQAPEARLVAAGAIHRCGSDSLIRLRSSAGSRVEAAACEALGVSLSLEGDPARRKSLADQGQAALQSLFDGKPGPWSEFEAVLSVSGPAGTPVASFDSLRAAAGKAWSEAGVHAAVDRIARNSYDRDAVVGFVRSMPLSRWAELDPHLPKDGSSVRMDGGSLLIDRRQGRTVLLKPSGDILRRVDGKVCDHSLDEPAVRTADGRTTWYPVPGAPGTSIRAYAEEEHQQRSSAFAR